MPGDVLIVLEEETAFYRVDPALRAALARVGSGSVWIVGGVIPGSSGCIPGASGGCIPRVSGG